MVALSWSNTTGHKFPDLVPVPYIHAALAVFARNVGTVQERLQHAILIENPWCYLAFARGGPDPFVVIGGHAADPAGAGDQFCRHSCGAPLGRAKS